MVVDIFKELEMVVDDKSFARFATAIQSLNNWHDSLETWRLQAEASSQRTEALNVWQVFAVAMLADVFLNIEIQPVPPRLVPRLENLVGRVKTSRNKLLSSDDI